LRLPEVRDGEQESEQNCAFFLRAQFRERDVNTEETVARKQWFWPFREEESNAARSSDLKPLPQPMPQ
jgi:hypothetical protein